MSKDIGDLFVQATRLKRLALYYGRSFVLASLCLALSVFIGWWLIAPFFAGAVLGSAITLGALRHWLWRNERQANERLAKFDEAFTMSGIKFESRQHMIRHVIAEALAKK